MPAGALDELNGLVSSLRAQCPASSSSAWKDPTQAAAASSGALQHTERTDAAATLAQVLPAVLILTAFSLCDIQPRIGIIPALLPQEPQYELDEHFALNEKAIKSV